MKPNSLIEEFEDLLSFNDESEQLEHDATLLSLKFISEINELMLENGIRSKKEMANLLGKTPSFVTQLFNGDKKLNMDILAKFQKVLRTEFSISTAAKQCLLKPINLSDAMKLTFEDPDTKGFWAFHNVRPYDNNLEIQAVSNDKFEHLKVS
ncbi:helix-turn-helix domain-containing protein [Mucilaginibacter rubeus]|uniref:Helix-turn-helix transcriptional regulator n=1 Tax=Mucilaginibacter rubeus TaxID=2027860 RepID=A0A5C1HUE1_9SPHI|nr:helix-turn-helix transcriptional regulator [Mucilaginibacter rubeus]QEM08741.1 helix-turn-helix transcriptional regulator [Mucilaginibacter rubeus]